MRQKRDIQYPLCTAAIRLRRARTMLAAIRLSQKRPQRAALMMVRDQLAEAMELIAVEMGQADDG